MEIYGRSLCVQVTMCHMTERQQLKFKSGLKNFPVSSPMVSSLFNKGENDKI